MKFGNMGKISANQQIENPLHSSSLKLMSKFFQYRQSYQSTPPQFFFLLQLQVSPNNPKDTPLPE